MQDNKPLATVKLSSDSYPVLPYKYQKLMLQLPLQGIMQVTPYTTARKYFRHLISVINDICKSSKEYSMTVSNRKNCICLNEIGSTNKILSFELQRTQ
jgi:hypothetical protein